MPSILRRACAAALIAALCSCSSNPLADADEAFESGDWNRALSAYENALARGDSAREDVGVRIGECRKRLAAAARSNAESLLARGRFEEAAAAAGTAEKFSPGAPENAAVIARARAAVCREIVQRARAAAAGSDTDGALDLLAQARAWCDDRAALDATAHGFLCDAAERALASGHFDKAEETARAAVGLESGNGRAAAVLAALASRKAEVEELVRKAQEARQDGKYDHAFALLASALELWPGHPGAQSMSAATAKERDFWTFYRAGEAHLSRKDWALAAEAFENARALEPLPDVDAKIREAWFGRWMEEAARLERDRKADAIAALTKALEYAVDRKTIEARIRSMSYAMLLDEGMAREVGGEWLEALDAYEKAAGFADDRTEIDRRIASARSRIVEEKCAGCGGTGKKGAGECPDCGGKGLVRREKK